MRLARVHAAVVARESESDVGAFPVELSVFSHIAPASKRAIRLL